MYIYFSRQTMETLILEKKSRFSLVRLHDSSVTGMGEMAEVYPVLHRGIL